MFAAAGFLAVRIAGRSGRYLPVPPFMPELVYRPRLRVIAVKLAATGFLAVRIAGRSGRYLPVPPFVRMRVKLRDGAILEMLLVQRAVPPFQALLFESRLLNYLPIVIPRVLVRDDWAVIVAVIAGGKRQRRD